MSILSIPKTRQTHTIVQTSILFHTELNKSHTTQDMYPYKTIHPYFHTNIHSSILKFHSSLLKFHSSLLVIFFLPSSFFSSSSSSSSSSLLSAFALSFSKTKNEIFILVLFLFDLIPFLFHFPVKGGNFLPLSFKPLVSSTIFFLISF